MTRREGFGPVLDLEDDPGVDALRDEGKVCLYTHPKPQT